MPTGASRLTAAASCGYPAVKAAIVCSCPSLRFAIQRKERYQLCGYLNVRQLYEPERCIITYETNLQGVT